MGGEEYFENGICLIEWGELIEDALPNDYIHITFKKDDKNENNRILIIESKEDLF
ncbi:MAG: tRNA (adenosine(37)-N6)-threonylcarbamoyltransferase complex ATPase subunit type 1 TsaE [Clostridia bacterium]